MLAFASLLLMTGLSIFTLTSALCALAPSLAVLIVARVLQGVGAAFLLPASLALITYGFPDARERANAIGIWAGHRGYGSGCRSSSRRLAGRRDWVAKRLLHQCSGGAARRTRHASFCGRDSHGKKALS